MTNKLAYLVTVLIVSSTFLGCMKDVSDIGSEITWTPGYALPIGEIEFQLGDILGESIDINPILESQLDTIAGFMYDNDLFQIPDRIVHEEVVGFSFPFDNEDEMRLTYFMLLTSIRNSIPASVHLQMYFRDENNAVLDSFYRDGPLPIEPATIDNITGEPFNDFESGLVRAEFNENELANIEATSNLVIHVEVSLTQIDDIITKYHPEQSFWMKMATEFHLELNTQ